MKNLLTLLVLIFCIYSCDTRKQSPSEEHLRTLKDVAKYIKTLDKNNPEQVRDLLHRTEAAFRRLPVEAEQDDSLVWYFQKVFGTYYGVCGMAREYPASLALMDSLADLHTPFLEAHGRMELLAMRMDLNYRMGRVEQATALADSLELLPDPKEGWRLVEYNTPLASLYHATNQMDKAIARFEKIVEACRMGAESDYEGTVYAWLGMCYNQTGRYVEGSDMILKAIRYFETHPENSNTVVAYGEQANSYFKMGMIDKALEMNRKAIEVSKRNGEYSLTSIYRFRGAIFSEAGQRDSMFYYYHEAKNLSRGNTNKMGSWLCDFDLLEAYTEEPDSLAKAFVLVGELCKDSTDMSDYFRIRLNELIGQAWMKSGQPERAIRELEQGVGLARESGMVENEYDMSSLLMDAYRQTGRNDRLAREFDRFKFLVDSVNTEETKLLVAGTNIRFETEKKEQQNRLLTTEVELKDSRLQNYAFIGLSLLAIGLCVGAWLWMRQHALRLRLRLEEQEKELATVRLREQEEHMRQQEERLQQIVASRQELNRNNEDLLRQLAEIQEANDRSCDLDRVMERLQPKLITTEEEDQFRLAFNTLHPTALHRLRTACSRVTRSEELLCMLIVLKQTNEEVSRTLGISRSSVLQNRYRLKQKLELPEGVELDSEVQRVMVD